MLPRDRSSCVPHCLEMLGSSLNKSLRRSQIPSGTALPLSMSIAVASTHSHDLTQGLKKNIRVGMSVCLSFYPSVHLCVCICTCALTPNIKSPVWQFINQQHRCFRLRGPFKKPSANRWWSNCLASISPSLANLMPKHMTFKTYHALLPLQGSYPFHNAKWVRYIP